MFDPKIFEVDISTGDEEALCAFIEAAKTSADHELLEWADAQAAAALDRFQKVGACLDVDADGFSAAVIHFFVNKLRSGEGVEGVTFKAW